MIIEFLLFGITVFYVLILLFLLSGLLYLKKNQKKVVANSKESVSVVIPFYNEENNLSHLLNSIKNLNIQRKVEFILVDDHSTDNSCQLIQDFISKNKLINLRLLKQNKLELKGKKHALELALAEVTNDIVLFTDADCILPIEWIEQMLLYFDENTQLVSGAVGSFKSQNFLSKLFALEFSSLIVTGAASIGIKHATFCNAANFGIRYSAYQNVKNKIHGKKLASGDDVFLLHAISSEYGDESIRFAFNENAIVTTNNPENLKEFFNQRIRWGSKAVYYKKMFSLVLALTVSFVSFAVVVAFFLSFLNVFSFYSFLVLFFVKIISELIFLHHGKIIIEPKPSYLSLFIAAVIHPFYITVTLLMSLFLRKEWKGRSI